MIKLFLLLLVATLSLSSKELVISFDKPYIYNERLTKSKVTIPKNSVIPIIDGFKINRANYKDFFKLNLEYLLDDETKEERLYKGKYWHVFQKATTKIEGSKVVREAERDKLFEAYKRALIDSGAQLYKSSYNSNMKIVFNLNNIWGVISVFPSSFEIKAVEVEPFKQSIKLDPNLLLNKTKKKSKVKQLHEFPIESNSSNKVNISISMMKPMPGFKNILIQKYPDKKMHFRFNQHGGQGHTYVIGEETRAEYEALNQKKCTCSYLEILKNYEELLSSLGAQIVGKDFPGLQNIYFRFFDRGDGKEIYGVVKAYNCGNYTISFLVPNEVNP